MIPFPCLYSGGINTSRDYSEAGKGKTASNTEIYPFIHLTKSAGAIVPQSAPDPRAQRIRSSGSPVTFPAHSMVVLSETQFFLQVLIAAPANRKLVARLQNCNMAVLAIGFYFADLVYIYYI